MYADSLFLLCEHWIKGFGIKAFEYSFPGISLLFYHMMESSNLKSNSPSHFDGNVSMKCFWNMSTLDSRRLCIIKHLRGFRRDLKKIWLKTIRGSGKDLLINLFNDWRLQHGKEGTWLGKRVLPMLFAWKILDYAKLVAALSRNA